MLYSPSQDFAIDEGISKFKAKYFEISVYENKITKNGGSNSIQ